VFEKDEIIDTKSKIILLIFLVAMIVSSFLFHALGSSSFPTRVKGRNNIL
jgi:hypothetical protein